MHLWFTLLFLFISILITAQSTQTFTTNGTFTIPAGVTSITVEAWGAGGGGASTIGNNQAGSGGGGGAYARSVFSVTAGSNHNIVVGSGGAANSNGGNSTFNSNWVIAVGGQGGTITTAGLGGSFVSSIGIVKYAGGNGGNSSGTSFSGGGGGGAGSTGDGGNASGITRGLGTSSNGGNGGSGVSKSSNGNIGLNYGGGGSGALRSVGGNRTGGAGANGLVIISWILGPTLIVNPTAINFGYVVNGGTSSVISYTLNGSNLTGAPGNITINAPANFEVSLSAGSGFSSAVNVPYSGITLASTTIYARFKPTASNTDYIGTITNTGGGATANVGVSGTSKPSYCSSTGNMSYQTSITRVQFNTINNTSAKPSGYSDFTSQSTNVNIGNSYNLSVNVNTDGNYTVFTNAWVDWNQDGDFLDAGETFNLGTAVNTTNGLTSLSPLNFTIPASATIGNTRMRVATKYNAYSTSCETAFDGEVEDYTLNVFPPCTIPTITGTTPASRCGTGTVVLEATASAGIINWYAASTGGISLGTGTIFTTPSITTTTTYWVDATDGGCITASRTAVLATVNVAPATPTTITGITNQCPSSTGQIYSITAVPNATAYSWNVPIGWLISAGQNSTSITVTTGTAGQNGNITVTASNSCGTSSSQTLAVVVINCFNKWKGNISNDWNTPANWTLNMIPANDANIIFDDAPLNHLVLDQNRSVSDISNNQSTYRLTLNGNKLTVKGTINFTGGAKIDASAINSTIEFAGTVTQSIPSGMFFNDNVNNLTVNNSNNIQLNGSMRLLNNLNTIAGKLDAFTFMPTIIYAGTNPQNIENNQFIDERVYNLTIDNAAIVNLNTNFIINNSILINVGKKLAVNSLNQLTILGSLTNNGGYSGLVLKSDANGTASLLHNTNNIEATVQRYISRNAEDWHFLSAPVSNQPINGTWIPTGTYGNGTGYDLYVWNEPTFCWIYKSDITSTVNWNTVHPTANFVTGRGYLYSVQENKPTKFFEGTLNNGSLNYPITKSTTSDINLKELEGFNLVGNPYPSSVDWSATTGWSRANLTPSAGGYDMWVWNPGTNNYGVYNSVTQLGTNEITRYIAPMQGFFVRATTNGNLGINNTVRVHTGAGNWFRTTNTSTGLIRITVQSETGKGSDEALLQFGSPKNEWGASKIFSHITSAPSLYLNAFKEDYSVQYFTNTLENTIVPIAFKAGSDGYYTLKFNFDNTEFDFIQLEDRLTKTKQLITSGENYRFNATVNETHNRFVLHFAPNNDTTIKEMPVKIYSDGNQLFIDLSLINNPSEVAVYDILGKLLLNKSLPGSTLHSININTSPQVLIIRILNEQGILNRKLFFYDSKLR